MFSNRKMPEARDFDENQKSIFLTCRLKIVAFCIVTEHQCDSFQAVGSHLELNQLPTKTGTTRGKEDSKE